MGMHFGVLAARSSWPELLAAIPGVAGRLSLIRPVPKLDEYDLSETEEGFQLLAGEHLGSAFVLDTSMFLAVGSLDRLVGLSQRLNTLVASCLAETVSGTFSLLVAEHGVVRRLYFNCHSSIYVPFQLGDPLPSESRIPLEDINGNGLFAAFSDLGFDYPGWCSDGSGKLAYLYTGDELENEYASVPDSLDGRLAAHHKEHAIPKDRVPKPTVVARRLPDGSTGWDITPGPSKVGILARLRSLFFPRN